MEKPAIGRMLLGCFVDVRGPAVPRDAPDMAERVEHARVRRQVGGTDQPLRPQPWGERLERGSRDVREGYVAARDLVNEDVCERCLDLDPVRSCVRLGRGHRVPVGVERTHGREARLRRHDREDARTAPEVDEAAPLELEQELHAELGGGMAAGADRARRLDHDRGRISRGFLPGRPDPHRADADMLVEGLPAVTPVRCDILPPRAAEAVPEALLTRRIGVRDQLDALARLDLLEAGREELEHPCPCCLCALGGDGNRDAAQSAQRTALFSLSKNPSPASYVSAPDNRSNSSSNCRCSSVSRRGTTTLTSTRWFPRPNPCNTGSPRPRSTTNSPDCVPASNVSSVSPSSVGTVTVAPSAACVIVR